jgi:N-acetylneuraminate synthase
MYKRSIYVSADIPAGAPLTENNLRIIRPALGIAPREWNQVIGKRAARLLKAGSPLKSEDFV